MIHGEKSTLSYRTTSDRIACPTALRSSYQTTTQGIGRKEATTRAGKKFKQPAIEGAPTKSAVLFHEVLPTFLFKGVALFRAPMLPSNDYDGAAKLEDALNGYALRSEPPRLTNCIQQAASFMLRISKPTVGASYATTTQKEPTRESSTSHAYALSALLSLSPRPFQKV